VDSGRSILFIFWLYYILRLKSGGKERVFAVIAMIQIILNWLVAIGTLGDHRQRLPILGLSLMLQAVGMRRVFSAKKDLLVEAQTLR
jgi:hypothetical protein